MIAVTIGETVRAARERAGRTLVDVAIEAGVSHETVRQIEIGNPNVRTKNVGAVLAALDLTDEWDVMPRRVSSETSYTLQTLAMTALVCVAVGVLIGLVIAQVAIATA